MNEPKSQLDILVELTGLEPGQIQSALTALDKMNLNVIDRREYERVQGLRDFRIDLIDTAIQEFIKRKVKKPSNLINFFPTKELAAEIVATFKIK